MLDEVEETGGKINWPAAIAVSVVFHIILFGFFWMISGSDKVEPNPESASATESVKPDPVADVTSEPTPPVPVPVPDVPPVTAGSTHPSPSTAVQPTVTPPVVTPPANVHPTGRNPPSVAQEETVDYVVKPGDFLSRIANKCKCTVQDIKRINGPAADKVLHPGDVLKVPVKH